MTRVLGVLGRLVLITIGYVVACLAASTFLHILFLGAQGLGAHDFPSTLLPTMILTIPFIALFIAWFAALPAAVVVLAAEVFGRRDWLFYAIGGAAIGVVIVGMFWQGALPIAGGPSLSDAGVTLDPAILDPKFYGLMVGGGIVGGLAYWLVAGRFGRLRRSGA